jgi:aspartyl-tRNA(Asn)/glutamyl-tRNA(Gln) amidotransferase subunit C
MLSRQEFDKLQKLARLRLPEQEERRLREQIERILDYVGRLEALDLEGIPAYAPEPGEGAAVRPDESRPGLGAEAAFEGAADAVEGMVRVPRVLRENEP